MAINTTLNLQSLASGARTNSTLTEPTSAASGDILVAALLQDSRTALTLPSGWALIADIDFGAASRLTSAWIRRGGSAPDLTFVHASDTTEGWIKRYTGCIASGSPLDVTASENSETPGAAQRQTATSITTVTLNAALICIMASVSGDVAYSLWTGPLTERYDGLAVGMADGIKQGPAGASNDKLCTSGGSNGVASCAILCALTPAPGTAAVTGTGTASITEVDAADGGKILTNTYTNDTVIAV